MIASLSAETPPAGNVRSVGVRSTVPLEGELPDDIFPDGMDGPEEPDADEVFLFPATLAQRRFWLLNQLVPGGNPALNMPLVLDLRGRLDVAALTHSLNEIIRRHEALRTTFHAERGQLYQVIAPTLTLSLPLVDVQDFPAATRAGVPAHLTEEERNRPFDLARGPVMRASLVRLAPDQHRLLVSIHHIVADGWSNGVIVRELGALYTAFCHRQSSPLPDLSVQFADFAQWQQTLLASGEFDAQLNYWRTRLAGTLPVLDLPVDHPRQPWRGQSAPGAVCSRRLEPEVTRALKAVAVAEGCSLFMVLLTAFTVVLNRYGAGQEDVLVGTSSANRSRLEVESLVGLFVNPLLLRVDLSGRPTVRALLGRVRQVVLEAFEHADAPFEKLVEELQPRRLQVNFLYQNAFVQPASWPEVELTPLDSGSSGALFEWMAAAVEDEQGITLSIEYHAGLFEAATVEAVLADFAVILSGFTLPGSLEAPASILSSGNSAASLPSRTIELDPRRLPTTSAAWLQPCLAGPADERGSFPLDPNACLRVLDRYGQPTPVGVVGEIYVQNSSQDLQATGDAGRLGRIGTVEWLGPCTAQVRSGGLRIERSFIEVALRSHPHVRDVVVPWRVWGEGAAGLCAYFVGGGAPAALTSSAQLRAFLKDHLPEDFLPGSFVRLPEFPLTSDGRIDEEALPDPPPDGAPVADARPDAPYLPIHYQLVEIWRDVLGSISPGIHDDFFVLGGNSLLAMRMLYQVEQTFGKTLLPATLFQSATIEHLANEILAQHEGETSPAVVRVQESGSRSPLFFLHGDISGGGFYCRKLARGLGCEQPFFALPPVEITNPLEDRPTIEQMAAEHLRTIRSVRPMGPYVIGGFCLGGVVAYEVARQLVAQGESVERLLIIDAEPRDARLESLRRAASWLGRWRGLDANRQLQFFCHWHYLLARWDRLRRLSVREIIAAVWRRLTGRAVSVAVPTSVPVLPDAAQTPTSWFDPRLDIPLVFLWAMGGYRARSYPGPTVLLLSSDIGLTAVRAWRRLAPDLRTVALEGHHLECITKHVVNLAEKVSDSLPDGHRG